MNNNVLPWLFVLALVFAAAFWLAAAFYRSLAKQVERDVAQSMLLNLRQQFVREGGLERGPYVMEHLRVAEREAERLGLVVEPWPRQPWEDEP